MQRKSMLRYFFDILSPLVLRLIIALIVELVLIGLLKKDVSDLYPYINQITALSSLLTIPFLLLMMRYDRKKEMAAGKQRSKKVSLMKYVYVVGISIAFAIAFNNVLMLSNLAEYSTAYQEAAESMYSVSLPVQIVCLGIIIPIMEELIFRGVIFQRMKMSGSVAHAIVSSSVLFGFYHGNSVQFIYATASGVLLAYLCEKYGSIKAPILAHVLMNIVSCILTEVDMFTWMFSEKIRLAVITMACAFMASVMFLFIRKIEEKP